MATGLTHPAGTRRVLWDTCVLGSTIVPQNTAPAYQTTWFQQLLPTQVRFLVSRFRMTSVVDLTRIR